LSTKIANHFSDDAPVRKFLFERSFDDATVIHRTPERKPILMKPDQVDALKKECYDEGFAAGKVEGKEEQVAQQTALLARIDQHVVKLIEDIGSIAREQEEQTRRLALAIAKKVLPTFVAQNGTMEIETMVNDAIREMSREPRLVVRINETQFDALNEKILAISTQRAFSGKMVVIAASEVASGDCRIEWADGGIERNTPATMNAIEQTILPSET
jgi:flagellar assembly protein FliH